MKKVLLTLSFIALSVPMLLGQCVPDTTLTSIVTPPAGSKFDTIGGRALVILPLAQVGVAYNEVLQFKVPKDTTYLGIPGSVDSVKLLQVLKLPPAFTLSCTPAGCAFPGGTFGCGAMTGTPTQPDSIELEVVVQYSITIGTASAPITDTLDGYVLVVRGNPMGLEDIGTRKLTTYPNPADNELFIEAAEFKAGEEVTTTLLSITGREIRRETLTVKGSSSLKLNVADLKPGVYLCNIRKGIINYTTKFSIAR